MIRKLAHVCLVTDQMAALRDFYVRQMGFAEKFAFRNKEGEVFGYYLSCGDSTFIEIFDQVLKCKQWGGVPGALVKGGTVNHLCFEVTGLPALRDELLARGVQVGAIKTEMDHSYQMWTADPDGNLIELMEYTGRSWQLRGSGAS